MTNESKIAFNLLFQYCLLNRRVYKLLGNNDFNSNESKKLFNDMLEISDGIHNLSQYESLSKQEKLSELSIFNESLKHVNLEDKNDRVIAHNILSIKMEVAKLIELLE